LDATQYRSIKELAAMPFRKSHAAAIAVLLLSAQAIATDPAADSKPAALSQVKVSGST
jgi:hypothetical protein